MTGKLALSRLKETVHIVPFQRFEGLVVDEVARQRCTKLGRVRTVLLEEQRQELRFSSVFSPKP